MHVVEKPKCQPQNVSVNKNGRMKEEISEEEKKKRRKKKKQKKKEKSMLV